MIPNLQTPKRKCDIVSTRSEWDMVFNLQTTKMWLWRGT